MRIGILTGGGDCPGLNAVIRAVCKRAASKGHSLIGFKYGWRGVLEDIAVELGPHNVSGIIHEGGTILRSSGDNPAHTEDGPDRVLATCERYGLDALVVVGGEGTIRGALTMWEKHQLPVVGVPKTIDNDLPGTDRTVGFDSALAIATEALDRLHTTAESHDRVMVCEVMGRTAGWLALYSGMAGGADVILLPEMEMTVEEAAQIVQARHDRGKDFSLVVVGEGYRLSSSTGLFDDIEESQELDAYGYPRLGGVSHHVARAIERLTGFETRVTILGHVQRGGSPTAADRALAGRFGTLAADLCMAGDFGKLVALRGDAVVAVPLLESAGEARVVPESMFELVRSVMG
jgi:ATP-dependent phosphofructokinase / diphosphate-dependent phosphofructokinase